MRTFDDACEDTPLNLTGTKLEQALIIAGEDPTIAKEHGRAYDDMLEAERNGQLITVSS